MSVRIEHDLLTKDTIADIQQQWQILCLSQTHLAPFLEWPWIKTWLQQIMHCDIQEKHTAVIPVVCYFYADIHLVGMTVLVCKQEDLMGLRFTQAFVLQTGQDKFDQPWIEFNDLLALPEYAEQCRKALPEYCFNTLQVDQFTIRSSAYDLPHWQTASSDIADVESSLGYRKSLCIADSDLAHLLTQFSSNKRSQIKRALRYISETYGDISCHSYQGKHALTALPEVGVYHQARWQDSQYGSGFANPAFVDFHTAYIRNAPPEQIEILAFTAGTQVLGYLYNFLSTDSVYFYLSGINYSDTNNKYKVGLVIHVLAMQYYAKRGKTTYDFMSGDASYKASLSDESYALHHTVLSHKHLKTQLFKTIHKVKTLID